jgi:hypothetical protein
VYIKVEVTAEGAKALMSLDSGVGNAVLGGRAELGKLNSPSSPPPPLPTPEARAASGIIGCPSCCLIGQNTNKVKHWKTFDVTLDNTLGSWQ